MHTNEKREDPLVELGYEIRDVDYPKVRKAVILFLSFGFFSAITGAFIYTNRFSILNIEEPKPGINAVLPRHTPPAITPLLQDNVNSKTDIAAFRQAETRKLTTTGYTDDTHEMARIPIERAMELIVQRGVKVEGASAGSLTVAPTTPSAGTTAPIAPDTSIRFPVEPATEAHSAAVDTVPHATAPANPTPAKPSPQSAAPGTGPAGQTPAGPATTGGAATGH